MTRLPMIYRSPVTRYLLALIAEIAAAVTLFGSGDKWRSVPSFRWLERGPFPIQVYAALLALYGALLLPEATRAAAYALGMFLFGLFTVSLIATINDIGPKNAIVIGAMCDCVVLHAYSIRTAWDIKLHNRPRQGDTP